MPNIYYRILINSAYIICFLSSCNIFAQSNVRHNNTDYANGWFYYTGNFRFNKRIGLHIEFFVRRINNIVVDPFQEMPRVGLEYYLKKNVRLTAGYAFVQTHYPSIFPEHRLWEQLLIPQTLGRFGQTYRFRIEQRFIGNNLTNKMDNVRYENRFRFMFRSNIALKGKTIDPKELYLALYDEVFLAFGKNVAYNVFEQNRAGVLLGYCINKNVRVEVGYLEQTQQRRLLEKNTNKAIFDNYHTLLVSIAHNLNLTKE